MTLQERIKKDLVQAIKEKDDDRKNTLRVILGEFGRMEKKELSDDEAIKVMQKLVKSEKEVLEKTGGVESVFIRIIEAYLPSPATEDEIRQWLLQNIDFARFKNKMQAMGLVMKHFGPRADGNAVKQILQNL
jgi:uncharacterized protein YqeY